MILHFRPHGSRLLRVLRSLRRIWLRIFQPEAIRLPGRFPWNRPAPLALGTVLIAGNPPVVADGKGGIAVLNAEIGVYRTLRNVPYPRRASRPWMG